MTVTRTVLILGGISDIGFAIAKTYAAKGWRIILAAREGENVERNVSDLIARYDVAASSVIFDACRTSEHKAFLDRLGVVPDTVISVVGLLGQQPRAEIDVAHATEILRANFEGPALLLGEIANRMAARGCGTIVGVSSVAGDRGRGSNYVYGSAKAGLTAFLSGLRNRLTKKGVHVLTVKPGFVRTTMTEGLTLPKPITADPEEVGRAVFAAAEIKKRNVIYVRPIWRIIMLVIAHLPESIFKKLRI